MPFLKLIYWLIPTAQIQLLTNLKYIFIISGSLLSFKPEMSSETLNKGKMRKLYFSADRLWKNCDVTVADRGFQTKQMNWWTSAVAYIKVSSTFISVVKLA